MGIFDPVAIDRQISSLVATIPQGSKAALIGHYDQKTKTFSLSVAGKVGDHVTVYGRVSKPIGKDFEGDAGIKVHFFITQTAFFLSKWDVFRTLRPRVGFLRALRIALAGGDFEVEL